MATQINLQQINAELQRVANSIDLNDLQTQIDTTVQQFTSQASQLGKEVNQVLGGFKSITQEFDKLPFGEIASELQAATGSLAANGNQILGALKASEKIFNQAEGVLNKGFARLEADFEKTGTKIGKELQKSAADAITALTGVANDLENELGKTLSGLEIDKLTSGFNKISVVMNNAKSIATELSVLGDIPIKQAVGALEEILPQVDQMLEKLPTVLENIEKQVPILQQQLGQIQGAVDQAVNAIGPLAGNLTSGLGMLDQLTNNLTGGTLNELNKVLSSGLGGALSSLGNDIQQLLPIDQLKQVEHFLLKGSPVDINIAARMLTANVPDLTKLVSFNDLELQLKSVADKVNIGSVLGGVTDISTSGPQPLSPTAKPSIPQAVEGANALFLLFHAVDRELTELVFHFAQANANLEGLSQEEKDLVNPAKWHFTISSRGGLQRSLALSDKLTVAKGHEDNSIGVLVLIEKDVAPAQSKAITTAIDLFLQLIPYGQIVDYDDACLLYTSPSPRD